MEAGVVTLGLRAYVSQLGPDGLGHDRCAPACLASYLLDQGWQSDPWLLLQELAAPGAPLAADKTHGADELIAAAQAKGFAARTWTSWPELVAAAQVTDAGVFCLVDNALLRPTAYPNTPAWHATHWIRALQLVGDDADLLVCDDPLCYAMQPMGPPYQGPVLYTVESVRSAIMSTTEDYAGVVVLPTAGAPIVDAEPTP